MQLRHESAGHGDAYRVPPRVAGLGLNGRSVVVLVFLNGGMVVAGRSWRMLVVVRSRPVVVIGVIVASVLVHVQRGPYGGRDRQGLNQHECQEPAHSDQSTTKEKTGGLTLGAEPGPAILRCRSARMPAGDVGQ
jgi:hypothetical protein